MSIGIWEIVLILVVAVLVFGAKRIPEIARALARASHEFKKARADLEKEAGSLIESDTKPDAKDETHADSSAPRKD